MHALQQITLILGTTLTAAALAGPSPVTQLPPELASLYRNYPHLHQSLGQYADTQSFTGPHERIATIVHELIHIDSAAKSAYVIHGQTYAPYNRPDQWPSWRFSQYTQYTQQQAQQDPAIHTLTGTPIYRLYINNIPGNTLANLADELNAYGQTAAWLCTITRNPGERARTTDSLHDLLKITNHYLTTLQAAAPSQYQQLMTQQKPARNLLALTIINARNALALCDIPLAPVHQNQLNTVAQKAMQEAQR